MDDFGIVGAHRLVTQENVATAGGEPHLTPTPLAIFDPTTLPPRDWIAPGYLCRSFVSVLSATGGTGKTSFAAAIGVSLASGVDFLGLGIHRTYRVWLWQHEDDLIELHRRIAAVMLQHGISHADLGGRLYCDTKEMAALSLTERANGGVRRSSAGQNVIAAMRERAIDALIIGPAIKLHDGDENSNADMSKLADELATIAKVAGAAVFIDHHNRKGVAIAGDMDSARGGRALIDLARLGKTMLPMSEDEARTLDIPDAERRRYVRIDDGKCNLSPTLSARWFRLASVALGNGDEVQAIERWTPPDMWRDLSPSLCCRIIDEIDAGLPDGERYSAAGAARARAAWQVVSRHAPTLTEKQAREVIKTWLRKHVLDERDYHSDTERKPRSGLFADPTKRPGACANG